MHKNTLLVIASLTISLVCGEVVLQFTTHNPNYYFSNRYLFVTPNYVRNVSDKLWTYTLNQTIQETVVYGFSEFDYLPGDAFEIEYQCSFNTNNLGLIQDRDFEKGENATVVLGDSFTTGHGGCPWFPRLSSRFPRINLLNGGLMGTGVIHWRHLVEYIKSQGVVVNRIIIIAITNDFKRGPWIWSDKQLDCINKNICDGKDFWESMPLNETDSIILSRAIERSRLRFGQIPVQQAVWDWAKRNFRTVNLVHGVWSAYFKKSEVPALHEDTEQSLRILKDLGVPIEVVLVTQKNEVGIFSKSPDAKVAESLLDKLQIRYRWCNLSPQHFMPIDSHPNSDGYDVLIECLTPLLD